MDKIHENYIAVVSKQDNGLLKLTREKILNDYIDVVDNLQEMNNNPNRTVLDMQQTFLRAFPRKEYFSVCWPYSYDASYIGGGGGYPEIRTYDEYNALLTSERNRLNLSYPKNARKVEEELESYKRYLKYEFIQQSLRYIHSYNFIQASFKIQNKYQTIMLSAEKIGWTNYRYEANEDVVISISTNFGYGNSSYFLLAMQYKGIDILPYSAIIKYYYANAIELRRCTRQYYLDRDSWNIAFDFVVENANMAKMNPQKFIEDFIVNEINEMILGLKNIINHPDTEIKRFLDASRNKILNGYSFCVRNINEMEIKDYEVYKDEMEIAIKAEKITGSLLFLEKLSELVEIFPTIQKSITEIKLLNTQLIPELEEKMSKIHKTIEEKTKQLEKLNKQLEELEEQIKDVDAQIKPHKELIQKLKEECKDYEKQKEAEEKYRSDNPRYKELCSIKEELQKKKGNLQNEIYKLDRRIGKRKEFIYRLEKCQNNIQTYLSVA